MALRAAEKVAAHMSEDEDKKLASHHAMLINSTGVKRGKDKKTEERISTGTKDKNKARKNERDT